jgi:hypothetical protein
MRVGEDRGSKEMDGCPLTATSVQTKYSWWQAHGQQSHYQVDRAHLLGASGTVSKMESLVQGKPQ